MSCEKVRKDAPISPNTMASSMQDSFGSDEEDVDDVKVPFRGSPGAVSLQPLRPHAHQRRDPKMQSLYLAAKAKPKGDDEDEDEDEDDVRRRTRRRTTRRRRMRTTTHESDRRACTKNLSEDLTLVSNTS